MDAKTKKKLLRYEIKRDKYAEKADYWHNKCMEIVKEHAPTAETLKELFEKLLDNANVTVKSFSSIDELPEELQQELKDNCGCPDCTDTPNKKEMH